jgi:hypothetical protein
VSWLADLVLSDACSAHEAAAAVVEALGAGITVTDWRGLDTAGRAHVLVAIRSARALSLAESGQDLAGARAYASVDGGRSAARLTARAAGEGVARALRQRREAADHG